MRYILKHSPKIFIIVSVRNGISFKNLLSVSILVGRDAYGWKNELIFSNQIQTSSKKKWGYTCRGRSHAGMNLFLRREETGVCTRKKPAWGRRKLSPHSYNDFEGEGGVIDDHFASLTPLRDKRVQNGVLSDGHPSKYQPCSNSMNRPKPVSPLDISWPTNGRVSEKPIRGPGAGLQVSERTSAVPPGIERTDQPITLWCGKNER